MLFLFGTYTQVLAKKTYVQSSITAGASKNIQISHKYVILRIRFEKNHHRLKSAQ